MTQLTNIVLETGLSAAQLGSYIKWADSKQGATDIASFLIGMAGGLRSGKLLIKAGAARATSTLTVSAGGSANNETCVIAGVTFTAKTSGAVGNQFNISATAATQAASMALFFNASPSLAGIVTASAVLGVVTLTAVVPGKAGNAMSITEDLGNTVLVTFATSNTGTEGTAYTIDLT